MPEQPNPRELLGGYATSTLSRQERDLLFAAALEDQQLFDELVNEESLRELLDDPLERRRLIDELSEEQPDSDRWFPMAALRRGSLSPRYLAFGGVGSVIVVAAIGAWLARSAGPQASPPTTQASRQEPARITPSAAAPASPAVSQVQKEAVKPAGESVDQSAVPARQADGLLKLAQEQLARVERERALPATTNATVGQTTVPAAAVPEARSADPPVATPSQNPDSDETAIRTLLHAYADAYSRLDVPAVNRLFPLTKTEPLAQAFRGLRSMDVTIRDETFLDLTSTTATVSCTWDGIAVPQVGAPTRLPTTAVFRLQKVGGSWVIVERR